MRHSYEKCTISASAICASINSSSCMSTALTVISCGRWQSQVQWWRRIIGAEQRVQRIHPLITRDPVTGGELLVTRLEGPESGIAIEGRFSLGWIGCLTPEQLEFVGLLLHNRA